MILETRHYWKEYCRDVLHAFSGEKKILFLNLIFFLSQCFKSLKASPTRQGSANVCFAQWLEDNDLTWALRVHLPPPGPKAEREFHSCILQHQIFSPSSCPWAFATASSSPRSSRVAGAWQSPCEMLPPFIIVILWFHLSELFHQSHLRRWTISQSGAICQLHLLLPLHLFPITSLCEMTPCLGEE